MTEGEKRRIDALIETSERNLKISELYSTYLTRVPTLINKDMIKALCEDGELDETEAIGALISEAAGLDFDRGREDRILIRDYIKPSVKVLDTRKYESDPYIQTVKLSEEKLNGWELKWECYPPYRAMICDDIILCDDMREVIPLGYFASELHFPAVLEGGNEWMTLSPVDTDTVTIPIERAHGKVVTFGLGLGYYAFHVSEKEDVESVTIIEKSPDVIRLFEDCILKYFPHKEKVRIIESDAFEYAGGDMLRESYDYAFVDTWRDASDGAPMFLRMKALEHLHPRTEFSYWIEGFIRSRIRAYKYAKLKENPDTGSGFYEKSYDGLINYLTDFSDVTPEEMEL